MLVEGNFDVISMHQAGFTETVAPLGTALTAEQIELLRRMAPEVVLFYDGDRAGRVATRAALELCLAADVPVRVAWRSRGDEAALDGQDPDTLLREGRIDVEAMIKGARDGLEAYTYALIDAARGAVNARAQILEPFLHRLFALKEEPCSPVALGQALVNTRALSANVAGALDPDYQDVHEKRNAPRRG